MLKKIIKYGGISIGVLTLAAVGAGVYTIVTLVKSLDDISK